MRFSRRNTVVVQSQLLRITIGKIDLLIGGNFREDGLHVSGIVVRELEGSVAPLGSCSFDQSEIPEHSGDRMFSINLSSVSEVENIAVEIHFAQNQVRAVHGYAIIGIQGVAEDDVDEVPLIELFLPLLSCQLRE